MTCRNITGKLSALGLMKGLHFYWPWNQLFAYKGKKIKPVSKG